MTLSRRDPAAIAPVALCACLALWACGGGGGANTAGPAKHEVTGTVTFHAQALAGVTVTAGTASTTTDDHGAYALAVVDGDFVVTPSKAGFTFSPAATPVTVHGANVPGRSFAATDTAALPAVRGMSLGGNWGGNVVAMADVPDAFIDALVADNLNWVGIKLPIFSPTLADPTVRIITKPPGDTSGYTYSFDDSVIEAAIDKLQARGLHVYLSLVPIPFSNDPSTCNTDQYSVDPHLWGDQDLPLHWNSFSWGSDCIPASAWWWSPSHPLHDANVAAFWDGYTQVAVKYAAMAEQHGVELFALGEETDRLFRTRPSARFPSDLTTPLSQLVSAVRAVYSGRLTYGQQVFVYEPHPEWWGLDRAASGTLFADLGLDVIGLSAAFTMSFDPVTTVWPVPQFESAWASVFDTILVPLQAQNPRIPIIFTDIAANDTVDIPANPLADSGIAFVFSDADGNGLDDGQEQQSNYFEALLATNASYGHLLKGVIPAWSLIDTDPAQTTYFATHRDIQIKGKPVEVALRNAYAAWALASP